MHVHTDFDMHSAAHVNIRNASVEGRLTLDIQSEVACSPPCLIVAHHLVHSTVTPGGAGDGDGADRGGYPTTTGDDLAISGPGEVGGR